MDTLSVPSAYRGRKNSKFSAAKIRGISFVPGEKLIPSIPCQRHRDILSSQAAYVIRRDDRGIAKRIVERARHHVYGFFDVCFYIQFVMLGTKLPRNKPGVLRFVKVRAGEANRKRFHWARAYPCHECHDD